MSRDCKVYVGGLPRDATERELDKAFSYYGPLRSVWVARNPPGFAFIEFEDPRDAEDAIRGLDGSTICGDRVRVERSTASGPGRGSRYDRESSRLRPFSKDDRCFSCGQRGHYAYDCSRYRRGGAGRSRSRSRTRSHSRGHRRSRSRSRSVNNGERSRSRSRHSRSESRSRSRTRSESRNRSRSPSRNGRK